MRRLDEGEEGGVGHHLAAVAPRVVEVDVPQEQGLPVRQQALQPVTTLIHVNNCFYFNVSYVHIHNTDM